MSTTIVSAFIGNSNNYRSTSVYLELGKHLLDVHLPKIIFLETCIIEEYKHLINPMTKLVPFEKHELLFSCDNHVTLPSGCNTQKDTKEYLQVMCNKTNWVNVAIQLNPFKSSQFVWVDFGLFHVFDSNLVRFQQSFNSLQNYDLDKVHIARIWNLDTTNNIDMFNYPLWFFAGGVFGGSSSALQRFHSLFVGEIQKLLNENKITWEINIWFMIYKNNQDLFDPYYGSHDESILEGY